MHRSCVTVHLRAATMEMDNKQERIRFRRQRIEARELARARAGPFSGRPPSVVAKGICVLCTDYVFFHAQKTGMMPNPLSNKNLLMHRLHYKHSTQLSPSWMRRRYVTMCLLTVRAYRSPLSVPCSFKQWHLSRTFASSLIVAKESGDRKRVRDPKLVIGTCRMRRWKHPKRMEQRSCGGGTLWRGSCPRS